MTKRAEYGFYVREHRDGTPWITAEWISGEDILDGGVTGLTLTINGHSKKGVSMSWQWISTKQ